MAINKAVMSGSVHLPYQLGAREKVSHSMRVRTLVAMARRAVAGIQRPRILDIGSGRGELLSALKTELDADLTAVDVDPVCVERAKTYGEALEGTLESIYEGNQGALAEGFDLIISSHSLEHMQNPYACLAVMKAVTRRSILIAVPNPLFLPNVFKVGLLRRNYEVNRGHWYCWDAPHLAWMLEGHLNLKITYWSGDWVKVVPRRMWGSLYKTQVLRAVEGRLLPKLFPMLCESLIVLCEKQKLESSDGKGPTQPASSNPASLGAECGGLAKR